MATPTTPVPLTTNGKPPPCGAYSGKASDVASAKVVPFASWRSRSSIVECPNRSTIRAFPATYMSLCAFVPVRAARNTTRDARRTSIVTARSRSVASASRRSPMSIASFSLERRQDQPRLLVAQLVERRRRDGHPPRPTARR